MGALVYNDRMTFNIEDRVLAHLQVVVINKLRRREAFAFTWNDGVKDSVCWMNPSIAVEFVYSGNRQPLLNRGWLELLAESANSNAGLIVMPEPRPTTPLDPDRRPQSPLKPIQPARPKRPTPPGHPLPEPEPETAPVSV